MDIKSDYSDCAVEAVNPVLVAPAVGFREKFDRISLRVKEFAKNNERVLKVAIPSAGVLSLATITRLLSRPVNKPAILPDPVKQPDIVPKDVITEVVDKVGVVEDKKSGLSDHPTESNLGLFLIGASSVLGVMLIAKVIGVAIKLGSRKTLDRILTEKREELSRLESSIRGKGNDLSRLATSIEQSRIELSIQQTCVKSSIIVKTEELLHLKSSIREKREELSRLELIIKNSKELSRLEASIKEKVANIAFFERIGEDVPDDVAEDVADEVTRFDKINTAIEALTGISHEQF